MNAWIIVYRRHGSLNIETTFYGPYANEGDAHDAFEKLPAIGFYDDDLHAGQNGCKYMTQLETLK